MGFVMRILITGGYGLLGGRLAYALSHAGRYQVRCASRDHREAPYPQLEHVTIDWSDPKSMTDACSETDFVIHCAGMNAGDCQKDPDAAHHFNGEVTARLVGCARKADVSTFIYLSTAHVYASPLEGHFTESTPPTNQHPYATSKLAGERALLSACDGSPMRPVVLRLSNAFGAPLDPDANCWMLVMNDIARQLGNSDEIVLASSGQQLRDFFPIGYLNRVVRNVIEGGLDQTSDTMFNIGCGRSYSVLDMANWLAQRAMHLYGRSISITTASNIPGSTTDALHFDVSRLQNTLGLTAPSIKKFDDELDGLLKFVMEKCRA